MPPAPQLRTPLRVGDDPQGLEACRTAAKSVAAAINELFASTPRTIFEPDGHE
jgi:hypothetical protein